MTKVGVCNNKNVCHLLYVLYILYVIDISYIIIAKITEKISVIIFCMCHAPIPFFKALSEPPPTNK